MKVRIVLLLGIVFIDLLDSSSDVEGTVCQCRNGGRCELEPSGEQRCICLPGTRGPVCETITCTWNCHQSDQCQYTGVLEDTCESVLQQNEMCPTHFVPCSSSQVTYECESDSDCHGDDLCCFQGCKLACRTPLNRTCFYQGLFYSPGDTIRQNCKVCTCLANGTVSCFRPQCPPIPDGVEDCDNETKSDQCCPTCEQAPRFENCPAGQWVRIQLQKYATPNTIFLPTAVPLTAVDVTGTQRHVHYRPYGVTPCRCPLRDRDYTPILAYAHDTLGRVASCHFRIFIADATPPNFKNCPDDIYARPDEVVTWQEPEVEDNVGVRFLKLNEEGDRTFPEGTTAVVYRAWDFDENEAICQFSIHVSDKYGNPTSESSGSQHSSTALIVGVVVALSTLLATLSVVIFCCFRRRFLPQDGRDVCRDRAPSEERVVVYQTDGPVILPPYSPPAPSTAPPAYDEIMWQSAEPRVEEAPPSYETDGNHFCPKDESSGAAPPPASRFTFNPEET